jgi:hypothetical protein
MSTCHQSYHDDFLLVHILNARAIKKMNIKDVLLLNTVEEQLFGLLLMYMITRCQCFVVLPLETDRCQHQTFKVLHVICKMYEFHGIFHKSFC